MPPQQVVERLGAIQAQDYAGAKWAVGQRTSDCTDADVEQALTTGTILRTHVLRPTWHFVVPRDIRWMIRLTAPRITAAMASYDRRLELDLKTYTRANDTLARALEERGPLTRLDLAPLLERARIRVTSSQRLAHIMMRAELDEVVTSGPRRGKQFTYALFDQRVGDAAILERDESLFRLATRYFRTRGPATLSDFAWWSGLSAGDAKRAIELAHPELERATYDTRDVWFMAGSAPTSRTAAHLLPNYDEYFIAYKDRSILAERLGSARAVIGSDARMQHVMFMNGLIVGEWRRSLERGRVVVQLAPLTELLPRERARFESEIQRFARFLEERPARPA